MIEQTIQLWRIPAINVSQDDLERKIAVLYERLNEIIHTNHHVRFATSLAAEDMVLTDAIVSRKVPVAIFTLDTGRLHA